MTDYSVTWYRDDARTWKERALWQLWALQRSEEDRGTWDALYIIARWHLRSGVPMMPELAEWIADRLEGQRLRPAKRGPSPKTVRDKVIASTVQALVDRGFDPTRNNASEARSACDAVAEALGYIGHKAIEKVWNETTPSDRVLLRPAIDQYFAAYENAQK